MTLRIERQQRAEMYPLETYFSNPNEVQSGFKTATLQELHTMVNGIYSGIEKASSGRQLRPLEFYTQIAQVLPSELHISKNAQKVALDAAKKRGTTDIGRELFLFLNMKSILAGVEPFLGDNLDTNDDLAQVGIAKVVDGLGRMNHNSPIAALVNLRAGEEVARYIKQQAPDVGLPVDKRTVATIQQGTNAASRRATNGLSSFQMQRAAQEIASEADVEPTIIYEHLAHAIPVPLTSFPPESMVDNTDTLDTVYAQDLPGALDHILSTLSEMEADMVRRRFGLLDGIPQTLDEIRNAHGISRDRAVQLMNRTLIKLRRPERRAVLRQFIEE